MRSVNSARERLNPVVLMFAILFAMTSRFCSWALIPVAAMASVSMVMALHRHPADFLVGGDRLVAHRQNRLQRALRRHDRFDDLMHRRRALHAADRSGFRRFQAADGVAGDLIHDLAEVGAAGRADV